MEKVALPDHVPDSCKKVSVCPGEAEASEREASVRERLRRVRGRRARACWERSQGGQTSSGRLFCLFPGWPGGLPRGVPPTETDISALGYRLVDGMLALPHLQEFMYAVRKHTAAKILPICMEPQMLNSTSWEGPIGMELGSTCTRSPWLPTYIAWRHKISFCGAVYDAVPPCCLFGLAAVLTLSPV